MKEGIYYYVSAFTKGKSIGYVHFNLETSAYFIGASQDGCCVWQGSEAVQGFISDLPTDINCTFIAMDLFSPN